MPTPLEFKAPFFPECYYHLVCKSIDGLDLFKEEIDYQVFIQRFYQFTADLLDVWSYSLLTNHTHHIIKVKPLHSIIENIKSIPLQTRSMKSLLAYPTSEEFFTGMVERQMNSFLVSYSNYTNNKYERKGGLFQRPFRRIQVNDDSHLQQAIIYVHANAQKHKIVSDFRNHPYTSYAGILNSRSNIVDYESVLNFFGGAEQFARIHKSQVEHYYAGNWPSSKLE